MHLTNCSSPQGVPGVLVVSPRLNATFKEVKIHLPYLTNHENRVPLSGIIKPENRVLVGHTKNIKNQLCKN